MAEGLRRQSDVRGTFFTGRWCRRLFLREETCDRAVVQWDDFLQVVQRAQESGNEDEGVVLSEGWEDHGARLG